MPSISTLVPAYGRDYSSRDAVERAFNEDRDFVDTASGKPINRPQIKELGIVEVWVRYAKLRKITKVRLGATR